MWDKMFTASLAAYSVSLVVFLVGHYVFQMTAVAITGIAMLGVTGVATGVTAFASILNIKASRQ